MERSSAARELDRVAGLLRAAGCVFAEEEAEILLSSASDASSLEDLISRRAAGLPLEHVVGWAAFCGLRIAVGPRVFVPRRRTELLAGEAALLTAPGSVVLDLCCGSGALGAALLNSVPELELYAADLDPEAAEFARRNLPAAAGVFVGDLFEPLPPSLRGRLDVVLANVPYVPTEEIAAMPTEATTYEARIALDGGHDGLRMQHRVAAEAPDWLAPGGRLLIETSARQLPLTVEAFSANGLAVRVAHSEELDATVVIGTKASA